MGDQFWEIFAAVLGANLATAAFLWGAVASYIQHKKGDIHDWGRLPTFAMLLPVLFLLSTFYLLDRPITKEVEWSVVDQRDTATPVAAPGAAN